MNLPTVYSSFQVYTNGYSKVKKASYKSNTCFAALSNSTKTAVMQDTTQPSIISHDIELDYKYFGTSTPIIYDF